MARRRRRRRGRIPGERDLRPYLASANRKILLAAACFCCIPTPAAAQTVATVGAGASIVEYEGFLTSTAATLTPAVRFDTPRFSIGGQGNWTVFESGNQVFQATAAAGWLTAPRERWRFELSGMAGAARYADEPGSGHILARGRFHFFAGDQGAWLGATTGASFDSATATPFELGVGAWTVRERFALVATITGTWLDDDRHIDIAGAARWMWSRAEVEGRVGVRPWADSEGRVGQALTGVWGEVTGLVPLTANISLELSGGSYSSDPVRRVLGAKYLTAGIRLGIFGPDRSPPLTIPVALAAARANTGAHSTTPAQLEIAPIGALHALRVHIKGATSVELMADFTDWQTQPLTEVSGGIWELQLQLGAGVHRLNIRIDGGEWLVPAGARPEQDEFGSVVGIVVVPER